MAFSITQCFYGLRREEDYNLFSFVETIDYFKWV